MLFFSGPHLCQMWQRPKSLQKLMGELKTLFTFAVLKGKHHVKDCSTLKKEIYPTGDPTIFFTVPSEEELTCRWLGSTPEGPSS